MRKERRAPMFMVVVPTRADQLDRVVDLQAVPPAERWCQIAAAIDAVQATRGDRWRLHVLLPDRPELARELPPLVAQLRQAGLRHDVTRAPYGSQSLVIAPQARWAAQATA